MNKSLNWYPIFILNALNSSLKVQVHSLSHQSLTTRVDLRFPHIVLSDALEASLSRLSNSLILPEKPEWLTELLKHQSTMQLHLKWAIQDEEIVAELVSAKADSGDWLATLLVSKADNLIQAVNRGFKVETMIQTRRLYNAA